METQVRSCGTGDSICSACCTALGISELRKPALTNCRHQCTTGCAVHETKPKECAHFRCGWLEGFAGGDDERPDKAGIVCFTIPRYAWPLGQKMLMVHEVKRGNLQTEAGRAWLRDRLKDGWLLRVRSLDTHPILQFHVSNNLAVSKKLIAYLKGERQTVQVHELTEA